MSVILPLESLNQEQLLLIKKHLIFRKEIPYFVRDIYGSAPEPVCIQFYSIDGDSIRLPYYFAYKLLNTMPNRHRVYPSLNFAFTKKLYEHQSKVVEDAMTHLSTHGTTTLALYTSFGKTVVGAFLASKLQKLTLVLYTQTILQGQWLKTFETFTDAKCWMVGEGPPPKEAHVILCMDTRFHKLPREYVDMIGTVIIDEADTFCTPTCVPVLLGSNPQYIVAMTATLQRADGMDDMITAVCGTHNVTCISQKPFLVYKFSNGLEFNPRVNKRTGAVDWTDLQNQVYQSEERNDMIIKIIKNNPERKILVMVWRIQHAQTLYDKLKETESVDIMAGKKKSYNDSRILIGTVSKIGRGFDESAACQDYSGRRIDLLLFTAEMNNVSLIEQVVGRVFRAELPIVIHFVDGFQLADKHWRQAQKWYKSRNGWIQPVDDVDKLNHERFSNDMSTIETKSRK